MSARPGPRFGAVLRPGGGNATKVLMGVLAAVWLLDLVSRGLVDGLLIMSNQAVFAGQFWRLFTAAFTSGGLLGTLMILLVLWIAGRAIESELGSWRLVALYFAAGLGGTTLLFVFGPLSGRGTRASAAAIGLLAANSIFKYKQREDVRADIGLFVLLVLYERAGRVQQLRLADADRRHPGRSARRSRAGVRAAAEPQHRPARRPARRGAALPGRRDGPAAALLSRCVRVRRPTPSGPRPG